MVEAGRRKPITILYTHSKQPKNIIKKLFLLKITPTKERQMLRMNTNQRSTTFSLEAVASWEKFKGRKNFPMSVLQMMYY